MEPDLYEVLQVHPAAEPEVIEAAFKGLIRKYHPDRNPSPDATEAVQRLTAAHEILRDPDRRAAYDRKLAARRKRQVPAKRPARNVAPDDASGEVGVELNLLGGLARFGIRRIRP